MKTIGVIQSDLADVVTGLPASEWTHVHSLDGAP